MAELASLMPWIETDKMKERKEFVLKSVTTNNFKALCCDYGISTKTGYKWKERFLQHGLEGMAEMSRRPKSSPNQLDEKTVCDLIRYKNRHPAWGPEKVHALYLRANDNEGPSLSSVKRVLDRAGLVEKRKKTRRKNTGRIGTDLKAQAANEVWTVDFKGWWRDPIGEKCEPLTVRDEYSRFILCIDRVANGKTRTVQASFERLFKQYGVPGVIRSDNGPPFASSRGLLGLSRLSVWWVALGIDLERGRPGCPQDNGAHERMHRDINRELVGGESSQAVFDIWRETFNVERPHKSLGNKTPGEIYETSEKQYAGTPLDIDYEEMDTRKVSRSGAIGYQGRSVFVSEALAGWSIGLKPQVGEMNEEVYFGSLHLGHLEMKSGDFVRLGSEKQSSVK